jgi:hypothetical protein
MPQQVGNMAASVAVLASSYRRETASIEMGFISLLRFTSIIIFICIPLISLPTRLNLKSSSSVAFRFIDVLLHRSITILSSAVEDDVALEP